MPSESFHCIGRALWPREKPLVAFFMAHILLYSSPLMIFRPWDQWKEVSGFFNTARQYEKWHRPSDGSISHGSRTWSTHPSSPFLFSPMSSFIKPSFLYTILSVGTWNSANFFVLVFCVPSFCVSEWLSPFFLKLRKVVKHQWRKENGQKPSLMTKQSRGGQAGTPAIFALNLRTRVRKARWGIKWANSYRGEWYESTSG